jgi:integrase/recombinase XerD
LDAGRRRSGRHEHRPCGRRCVIVTINWPSYPAVAAHPATHAFIESQAKRQKASKTIDAYARNLEDLLRTWPGAPPERLLEVDAADIDTYLARLTDQRELADATVRQRLVTARLFFDFCLQRRLRRDPVNPVARGSWRPPQRGLLPRRERLPWIPSDEEWRALLADLFRHESLRNQALVLLAYDAALRRRELLRLRLDDIDWSIGLVHIRAESAKGERARSVPISAGAELLLRQYVHTVRSQLLAGFGGETAGPLFLAESQRNPGVPLRDGAFNDIVARLARRLALPQLHPHTFRHMRCTVLKRGGLDLDDIALFAGHASISSTRLYVHLAPTELGRRLRDATAAFDRQLARHIEERVHGDSPALQPH